MVATREMITAEVRGVRLQSEDAEQIIRVAKGLLEGMVCPGFSGEASGAQVSERRAEYGASGNPTQAGRGKKRTIIEWALLAARELMRERGANGSFKPKELGDRMILLGWETESDDYFNLVRATISGDKQKRFTNLGGGKGLWRLNPEAMEEGEDEGEGDEDE